MTHRPCFGRCSSFAVAVLLLGATSAAPQSDPTSVTAFYVSADAGGDGDGSKERPFASLSKASAVSASGDTIFVRASQEGRVLDGGITLKPGQKLIGVGADGERLDGVDQRVMWTNTSPLPGGTMVRLSSHNEIAGFHFLNLGHHAISGEGTNYSGTYVHHTTFAGNADVHIEDERGLVYAISLDAAVGRLDGIRIEDCIFRDGPDLGAIRVFHSGDSRGHYVFQRNTFSDLGGRAYFVRTRQGSRVETTILDSTANNIGRGNRNSDSIIPYLMGQSEQVMLVRGFHFRNTAQEGNSSNTGIEAYMFGSPRPDEANWCTDCRLTLKIVDSVIENAVTDSIQFSNAGRNSELSYEIRNTRVTGGDPQQGGGGISLNVQGADGGGGSTTLLIEDSDVIGTTGYGFSMNDPLEGAGHTVTVDLGGGVLGSRGNNRFVDNARGAMRIFERHLMAANNWWGGGHPTIYDSENQAAGGETVVIDPVLETDPR